MELANMARVTGAAQPGGGAGRGAVRGRLRGLAAGRGLKSPAPVYQVLEITTARALII